MSERIIGRGGYLAYAWALMRRDRGWLKPLLILTLLGFVPVFGQLVALGFGLEWARLVSWGADGAPKQRGVRVLECLKSGWRGFVVIFVWSFVVGIAVTILTTIAYYVGEGFGDAVGWVLEVVSLLAGVLALAAAVRAAIYQSISAGLGVTHVLQMARRDPKGVLRLVGVQLALSAIAIIIVLALLVAAVAAAVPLLGETGQALSSLSIGPEGWMAPDLPAAFLASAFVVTVFVVLLLSTITSLLALCATGLWMRQFDVRSWGGPEDPLPAMEALVGA